MRAQFAPSITSILITTATALLPAQWSPSRTHRLAPCTSSQSGTRRAAVTGERAQGRQARREGGRSVGAALARDSCPSRSQRQRQLRLAPLIANPRAPLRDSRHTNPAARGDARTAPRDRHRSLYHLLLFLFYLFAIYYLRCASRWRNFFLTQGASAREEGGGTRYCRRKIDAAAFRLILLLLLYFVGPRDRPHETAAAVFCLILISLLHFI